MRCDLQIFSGCVCHLEQLHAQSPFLFPIVFSINKYANRWKLRFNASICGVLVVGQKKSGKLWALVDVRVFHPDCPSYLSTAGPALYKRFEKEKKRQYGQKVREVELGSFAPIVFSTTGGMGAEAQTFYRRLAGQLSIKKNMPFHLTMKWLRTHLSVILLRSSLMCLRGSRSIRRRRMNLTHVHPEVVCFDSRLV